MANRPPIAAAPPDAARPPTGMPEAIPPVELASPPIPMAADEPPFAEVLSAPAPPAPVLNAAPPTEGDWPPPAGLPLGWLLSPGGSGCGLRIQPDSMAAAAAVHHQLRQIHCRMRVGTQ